VNCRVRRSFARHLTTDTPRASELHMSSTIFAASSARAEDLVQGVRRQPLPGGVDGLELSELTFGFIRVPAGPDEESSIWTPTSTSFLRSRPRARILDLRVLTLREQQLASGQRCRLVRAETWVSDRDAIRGPPSARLAEVDVSRDRPRRRV